MTVFVPARNRKITNTQRENLVKRMVAGELTRTQAAEIAGVTSSSVTSWLLTRGVVHLVPHGSQSKYLTTVMRDRLVAHILAGEITRSEAAQIAGITTAAVVSWAELRGTSAYSCRDKYLRKLLPDLMEGRKSVYHPPLGIKA